METKKFNYEAPEAVVFGVETQNCFASGGVSGGMQTNSLSDFEEDEGKWL